MSREKSASHEHASLLGQQQCLPSHCFQRSLFEDVPRAGRSFGCHTWVADLVIAPNASGMGII